jgi:thiol-disulfide isomerase/thioredoxin
MKTAAKILGALAALVLLAGPSFAILKPGDKVIPFSLKNIDGKDYTVTVVDGRLTLTIVETVGGETRAVTTHPDAVLIDFWATYCVPCRKAMPHMQQLNETYRPAPGQAAGGLHVIGIALDEAGGKVVRPFYQKLKITYPLLADAPSAAPPEGVAGTARDMKKRYGIQEIPVVYVIDATGTIAHAHVGATDAQMAELDAAIKSLVGGAAR